jgi:hypothetical protein
MVTANMFISFGELTRSVLHCRSNIVNRVRKLAETDFYQEPSSPSLGSLWLGCGVTFACAIRWML